MTGPLAYLLRPRALLLGVSVVLPWEGRGLKPCARSLMLLLVLHTGHVVLRMRRESLPQLGPASGRPPVVPPRHQATTMTFSRGNASFSRHHHWEKQVCQLLIVLGQAVQTFWGQTF